jgi:hypothetical protein
MTNEMSERIRRIIISTRKRSSTVLNVIRTLDRSHQPRRRRRRLAMANEHVGKNPTDNHIHTENLPTRVMASEFRGSL